MIELRTLSGDYLACCLTCLVNKMNACISTKIFKALSFLCISDPTSYFTVASVCVKRPHRLECVVEPWPIYRGNFIISTKTWEGNQRGSSGFKMKKKKLPWRRSKGSDAETNICPTCGGTGRLGFNSLAPY